MQPIPPHIMQQLFEAIAAGDEAAFHTLFEQYKGKVYAVVYHLTKSPFAAEELTQEVFISLWVSRQHLAAVLQPDNYIYRTIYNKVSSYLKNKQHEASIVQLTEFYREVASNATEEQVQLGEQERLVQQAVQQLPPQQQLVYRLNKEKGLDNKAIGELLQLSPHTVKNHLTAALKTLRQLLGKIMSLFF